MDEQRFADLMLDELYGELDEATSAQVKRYAATHPEAGERLRAMGEALRAHRAVPVVVPDNLEAKVLQRAREARSLARSTTGMARVVSVAGRWAMKPQTAMAALFVLMVGSSVLLVRGRHPAEPQAAVHVTEEGTPVEEATPFGTDEAPDPKTAALAHGAQQKRRLAPSAAPAESDERREGEEDAKLAVGGGGAPPPAAATMGAPRGAAAKSGDDDSLARAEVRERAASESALGDGPAPSKGAGAVAAAPPASPAPAAGPPPPARAAAAEENAASAEAPRPGAATGAARPGELEAALAAYHAHDYDAARARLDRLAAAGNGQAALWSARATREGYGCGAAAPRFDAVATRFPGTPAAHDATLEGGRCYRATSQRTQAQARFVSLLGVPSHRERAQQELQILARDSASRSGP